MLGGSWTPTSGCHTYRPALAECPRRLVSSLYVLHGANAVVRKFRARSMLTSKPSRVRSVRLDPQEEQAILEATHEMISRLGVHKLNPKIVIVARGRSQDPQIYGDRISNPMSLSDKLTPDEWTALIASKLNYRRNFDTKRKLAAFSYEVFPYVTIPLFLVLGFALGIFPIPEPAASGLIILWVIAMIPAARVLYAPFFRRLLQTADRQTLELFLNPTLENVLRKIETIDAQGSKANKTIERRIRNLHQPS